jgi:uncharacterized protein YjbJ (UPF0337 family)
MRMIHVDDGETNMTEQFQGAFRILSGGVKALWGRLLRDGALVATGRVEQVAGEAAFACGRARARLASR